MQLAQKTKCTYYNETFLEESMMYTFQNEVKTEHLDQKTQFAHTQMMNELTKCGLYRTI